jgi:PAS domain S-box-containing protein
LRRSASVLRNKQKRAKNAKTNSKPKAKPRARDPSTLQRELEAALASYTDLFDYAPIAYATIDATDIIRSVNHAGVRLLTTSRRRLVGARLHTLLSAGEHAAVDGLTERARGTDRPVTGELRVGARVLHVHASLQPHQPDCLLLALEDVTARTAEQTELAKNMDDSRQSNRRKDEFIAMLSHELRNPLAPIRMSFYVLANGEPGSRAMAEASEIAERQLAHLTRLVDDLLDVTRINSGKIRLHLERADLAALVNLTVDDHRPGFAASGVELVVACPPGPVWVEVDTARIVQVVSNLLGNAQKFTPEGGRVEIAVQVRGEHAVVRIRDTGDGIARELLPAVFEPFTQAPQSSDRSGGGLGLGLAMVKALVELHRGAVRICSEGTGTGTEVIVSLPIAAAAGEVTTRPSGQRAARPRNVLVIEDQPDTALVLATALRMLGHVVRTAETGLAGLELARVFRPEIVLCDLGLPGMDGYQIARAFRRDRELREVYLVALSGYAQPEDIERSSEAGFSRHIAKPASLDTLALVIGDVP